MSWYIGFERRFEFDWLREAGFWEVHFGWLYFGAVDVRPPEPDIIVERLVDGKWVVENDRDSE